MAKISISLPDAVVAAARDTAAAAGGTLSGYIADAVREKQLREAAARHAAWQASLDDDDRQALEAFRAAAAASVPAVPAGWAERYGSDVA
jgi:hypothetical protein